MQKNKFYTDLNLINLPIFSSSKKIKTKSTKEKITVKKNNQETQLAITYPGEKLTFFDRKTLASIEYLFCNSFDFDDIEKTFNKEYKSELDKFLKKYNIKNENKLNEAEKQQIMYISMENVQKKYRLFLTFKDINSIVFNKTYGHSKIKKALTKLNETKIHSESHYFIDNSFLKIPSINLLNVLISEGENKNSRNSVVISLNPFHLINIIQKKVTRSDLKLLNSFNTPIAGRLSELLKKSLYGSKSFKKDKVIFDYNYICDYLQIEKRKSESLIIQQLKNPFNELVEKKIIINWILQKNLFGYEVVFYHSLYFYEDYFKLLDKDSKLKINHGIANLYKNHDKHQEFMNRITLFLKNIQIKDKNEIEKIKSYYSKYLYFTEFKF